MPRLFLRFDGLTKRTDDGFEVGVDWLVRGDDGTAIAEGHADASQLVAVIEGEAPWAREPAHVVVLVPTAEILALSCQVPGRNVAQLRRAAPYAVEEFITEDIDAMHVACGELARNEPVRSLVASRRSIEDWRACLSAAAVTPGFMTADAMALPAGANRVSVLFEEETALVRTSEQIASVDVPNLAAVLEGVRGEDVDRPAMLCQINGTLSEIDLSQSGFAPAEVENVPLEESLLSYLANSFDDAQAINILQGDFAVKRRGDASWMRWRSVAAGAGVWGVIALIFLAAEGFWAAHQADEFRQQAAQLYRDIYDVERVPGNPATRMRLRLGEAATISQGFHRLLANLGTALQEIGGRYDLQSLSYSERGGLGADMIVADYDALDRLEAELARRGFDLEVVSAEQHEARVRANLRIADG